VIPHSPDPAILIKRGAKTNGELDDVGNNKCSHNGQCHGKTDGFELLNPQGLSHDSGKVLCFRLELTVGVAKTPVMNAPKVPPTPWTPKVSKASSYLSQAFRTLHARKGIHTCKHTDNHRARGVDETCGRSDDNETCDCAGAEAKHGGLPRMIHSSKGQTVCRKRQWQAWWS